MDDLIDFGRGSREIKESLLGIMGNDVPGKLFFENARLEDEDFYQKLDEMSESRETKKFPSWVAVLTEEDLVNGVRIVRPIEG